MSKTRVLICNPNLHGGGAERLALQLFQGLDRDRFAPRMFIHERQGALLSTLTDDSDITFQHDQPYRRAHLPANLRGTLAAARKADVIIGANEGRAAFLALIAAQVTRKPLILWLHSTWTEFRHAVSWRQMAALRQFGRADAIVACADGVGVAFGHVVPSAAGKLTVIRNGCPVAQIQSEAALPIEPGHEALFDRPVVVNVGRLSQEKGQDILIRAHAMLIGQGLDHRLLLIGEGDRRAALTDLAQQLGVADSVHLLGFQANPHRYTARATIFALSSRFEGFPLVLVEAMACGRAIVATDCPTGPREALDGGKSGLLVPVEDAGALAEALERLLSNPDLRGQVEARARARSAEFDISAMLAQWQDLIEAQRRI